MGNFEPQQHTIMDSLRESRLTQGILAFGAVVAASAFINPNRAEAKIIHETSSITPIPGAPAGEPLPPSPGGQPLVEAPTHTTKQPGVVDYEITVPHLAGDASISFAGKSKLLALQNVGSQKVARSSTVTPSQAWTLHGTNTTEQSGASEGVGFKLSKSAHLGNKVCSTMVIRETSQNAGWIREDDYTDQECTTVSSVAIGYRQALNIANAFFTSLYNKPGLPGQVMLNFINPSVFISKSSFKETDKCNPRTPWDPSDQEVYDQPPALLNAFCTLSNGHRQSQIVPRTHLSVKRPNYTPLLESLDQIAERSIGIVDTASNRPNHATISPENGIDIKYSRAPGAVKELEIQNGQVKKFDLFNK